MRVVWQHRQSLFVLNTESNQRNQAPMNFLPAILLVIIAKPFETRLRLKQQRVFNAAEFLHRA